MSKGANRRNPVGIPPDRADYEVGNRKPPVHSRFQPGQSGNPKGRPKGTGNRASAPLSAERLKAIILQEAYRAVKVNGTSGQASIPMAQAIVRALAVNAAKGLQRSQRLFTDLLATTERENRHLHDQWLEAAITYKVDWERELARRERLGLVGPDPLPHPDHVVVDLHAGTALIKGPATKEEKAVWDLWLEHQRSFEDDTKHV